MSEETAEAEKKTEETTDETWLCGGFRIFRDGKTSYLWIADSGNGEERYYQGTSGCIAGALYTVKVGYEDGSCIMYGKPKWQSRGEEDKRREMEAAEHAAKVKQSAIRRERADGKHKALDEALEPLIKIAQSLRTGAEKDAFLAYVIRNVQARSW